MAAVAADININGVEATDAGRVDIPPTNGSNVQPKDEASTKTLPKTVHKGYPESRVKLIDRHLDEPRKLRVVVIGGGLAGILAGVLLPEKVPGIELVIYEKNPDFGGTWYENVYPGVRCDIPSHVYQSTFSPKTDWSDEFAPGAEIRDYWQSVARKYNVYRLAKFNHRVDEAAYDAAAGKWNLNITDLNGNTVVQDTADFVLTCIGRFNSWKLPDYPGLSEYKGLLRHASHWDPEFDPTGKRVAVIGNGASGIQLVANLQPVVSRLDHYARSKTWIAASWAGDERTLEPQPIPAEKKEVFEDPQLYLEFRKTLEDKYWRRFHTFLKGEANDNIRAFFIERIKARLAKKPELLEELLPDFSPNCRRLTPGPGYLEALQEENLDFIRQPIKRFTETGIETVDGKHREVDAVFCATGANGNQIPPFPIRAHGKELGSLWHPDGEYGFPYSYLGAATPGFPNLFFVHGPNSTGPSGTVPHSVEVQLAYYAKFFRKVSREGIKTIVPKKKAADDFVEYCDAFFSKTVLNDGCSSWYNGLCNFAAPGIWSAMNSLGAGGTASPKLTNTANALTFCLMIVSCYLSPVLVHYIGIKGALSFGTIGYAPYAAGLYMNSRYGTEWLELLGSALCGVSAGVFWMAETAIAIAYPEPWNKGKALGYWLTYRLSGQIIGGAVNLGLNVHVNTAGKVSYVVYIIFIAIQAAGPFVAFFLNKPSKVQRKDGRKVSLEILQNPWHELKQTAKLFCTRKFLSIVLFIGQAVFAESVFFTYLSLWFSVRARALGSFLGGIAAIISGNILGLWIDRTSISLKHRVRYGFAAIVILQGAWWTWATVIVTRYSRTHPTYDWVDPEFGGGFGVFIFLTIGFQVNYLFLYFIIQNLAGGDEALVIRYAALLRGTESAWQALSYGLESLTVFAEHGGVYMNFGLWAVAILPAWTVLRHIGETTTTPTDSDVTTKQREVAGVKV
ncbi:hypothetical protein VPNG_04322 [Cytospora leucostoma]|uniref:Uncharacterized protein n=1 Tax=Cytospora leucostoma TaxID=1230097 RepID=A0A423XDN0_9PEZI|nr:hypothetical protein VPNG_04322 [Cytospora leucostoma]